MIRLAELNDIPLLNKIGAEYNANFAKLFHLETELAKDYSIILVAENGGIIQGFLYALDFPDNIDLLYIITTQERQNEGIATELLTYLVDNYQVNNKSIILEVAVNNLKALKLYQKFNFYEVNRRLKYYGDVDALLMRRD